MIRALAERFKVLCLKLKNATSPLGQVAFFVYPAYVYCLCYNSKVAGA